jgi:hypothetical protein
VGAKSRFGGGGGLLLGRGRRRDLEINHIRDLGMDMRKGGETEEMGCTYPLNLTSTWLRKE